MKTHKRSYHCFSAQDVVQIRSKLTEWYNANRRKLPWRGDPPPYGNECIGINELSISEPPRKKRKLSKDPKQPALSTFFKPKQRANSESKSGSDIATNSKSKKTQCDDKVIIVESPAIPVVTAYHIWVSEVMLQQTRVETVIKYYLKWMEHFPTIEKLAAATLDEVNSVWAGLGYYRRAKFLHEAAAMIIDQFNGTLPKTLRELKSIKGIGDYTAGAVSSIAYNQCNAAVDGNLVRVLSRLRAIACTSAPPLSIHWDLAKELVAGSENPGILNQALMEMGACICTPKVAKCTLCPISSHCKTLKEVQQRQRPVDDDEDDGDDADSTNDESIDSLECDICGDLMVDIEDLKVEMYPMKKAKTKVREQVIASLILIVGDHKILMIKRPNTGLLADQWEFPMEIMMERDPAKASNAKKGKKKKNTKETKDNNLGMDSMDRKAMLRKLMERVKTLGISRGVIGGLDNIEYCGSTLHIFSHIKQICNVFTVRVEKEEMEMESLIDYEGEHQWIGVDEMKSKRITKCVQKQWVQYCKFDGGLRQSLNGTKTKLIGRKRKRKCIESDD